MGTSEPPGNVLPRRALADLEDTHRPDALLRYDAEFFRIWPRRALRSGDLDEAFRDPGVRAVLATRGGKGAYRIAAQLDVEAARACPRVALVEASADSLRTEEAL